MCVFSFMIQVGILFVCAAFPLFGGDGISRVGTYQEYSGYHGSGGGYSGPSADHWMFHERQTRSDSSSSSHRNGSASNSGSPSSRPVTSNLRNATVEGAYVFTDKRTVVEFHEYSRGGPSQDFRLVNRELCEVRSSGRDRNGGVLIRSFVCSGRVANLSCQISGDTLSCNADRADGEHTGRPGYQTVRLTLTDKGDYSAWVKSRIVGH
jgi:hypothetical protein